MLVSSHPADTRKSTLKYWYYTHDRRTPPVVAAAVVVADAAATRTHKHRQCPHARAHSWLLYTFVYVARARLRYNNHMLQRAATRTHGVHNLCHQFQIPVPVAGREQRFGAHDCSFSYVCTHTHTHGTRSHLHLSAAAAARLRCCCPARHGAR